MNPSTSVIVSLLVALAASCGLLYYIRVVLPAQLSKRVADSLKAFSKAVELRFPTRAGITEEVVDLAVAIGTSIGMGRRALTRLAMAARLSDIGLCSIPYEMINGKAPREWSEAERAIHDRHPEVSAAMLELVPFLRHLAPYVRYHHVPFDGSAGPIGPSGHEIPIESRILAVATEYVTNRRIVGSFLAREGLRQERGRLLDPDLVEIALTVLTSDRDVVARDQAELVTN